jgi:type I restriction enzyme S subunit
MSTTYKCNICNSKEFDTKTKHTNHLKTKTHAKNREAFEEKLGGMSSEKLIKKYKSDVILEIISQMSIEKIKTDNMPSTTTNNSGGGASSLSSANNNNNVPAPTEVINYKQRCSEEVIWKLSDNEEENKDYVQIKKKLDGIIKSCHQELYSSNSIVGSKAQNDIMKILCLKLLEPLFKDTTSSLYKKCEEFKKEYPDNYEEYMKYCTNMDELQEYPNEIIRVWRSLDEKVLVQILSSVYTKEDNTFNCKDERTIRKIIMKINELKIDKKFVDAFSTTCGDIHECFRAYGGKQGAKELGQFFTPRKLIHLIFHGLKINKQVKKTELENEPTIYDPCMGTAGFLTNLYKLLGMKKANNVYGCETESDAIKFGMMSILLTTGDITLNVLKCNSLCENDFINKKKFNAIFTNPPFGTRIKYKEIKEIYERNYPNRDYEFKDIYPIETNNGACLFIQHCVFMLEENGFCAIVLPDGELFEGNTKWCKTFREWWCKNVCIKTILKVEGGTFDHTGIKTNVVIFTKTGKTKNIKFIETNKECNKIKEILTIPYEALKATEYSLSIRDYIETSEVKYDVTMMKLGEITTIQQGKQLTKKELKNGEYKVIGGGKIIGSHNEKNRTMNSIVMTRVGDMNINYITEDYYLTDNGLSIVNKNEETSIKYIYCVLKFNSTQILKLYKGTGQQVISKTQLEQFEIPVPPLEIQQKIVDELDKLEKNKETIELSLKQLKIEKELFLKFNRFGELKELFKNSEEKELKNVCDFKNGSNITKKELKKGEYPVIGGGVKPMGDHDKYNVEKNTIIISKDGANAGYVSKCDKKTFVTNHGIYITNIKSNIMNDKYLYNYLKIVLEGKFYALQTGAGQPGINKNDVEQFEIPVPSLENQKKIVELWERNEQEAKDLYDKNIELCNKRIETINEIGKQLICSYCSN